MLEYFKGNKDERVALKKANQIPNKRNYTPNELRAQEKARAISRRLFIRRVGAVGLGTVGLLTVGTGVYLNNETNTKKEKDPEDWLSVTNPGEIGKERVNIALNAAKEWNNRFKAGRKIYIAPFEAVQTEILPNGSKVVVTERAQPGLIQISHQGDVRSDVLHAMTHAAQPDNPTLLDAPMRFSAGHITGYHGLSVLVTLDNGEQTAFTKVEEGMAERNGSVFSDYTVGDPSYLAVGKLAISQFPFDRFGQAHEWAKSNDFPSLVRARLSLPLNTTLTSNHVETVMTEYQQAWNNGRR